MVNLPEMGAIALMHANDPLAGLADPEALDALAAGGTLIGLLLSILFFIWLGLLGVLLPWFVWRTKVYTKRQYLLSKRMFELMRQQALHAQAQLDGKSAPRRGSV
ncbi:MAG: hypothetical protein D6695_04165 [Planctomycetota bacterium]|nr:MAG: hypothetical protein D6695_04165 [Planctomycetota bacterium]